MLGRLLLPGVVVVGARPPRVPGRVIPGAGMERALLASGDSEERALLEDSDEEAEGISVGQAAVYSGFTLAALFVSGAVTRLLMAGGRKAAEEDGAADATQQ